MYESREKFLILLIDCDAFNRQRIKEILHSEFAFLECETPSETLEILTHQNVDLVISNYILPEMSGTHLSQTIKKRKKFIELPLILIIEEEDIDLVQEGLEAGITQWLYKPFTPFALQIAVYTALSHRWQLHTLNRRIRKLKKHAERDPLTNFYNRYVLYEQGKKEVSKAQRGNLPLSILMIDIDSFKSINDSLGHLTGDEVLMEFSELLASTLRSIDLTTRFGGEEFVILLPLTDSQQALIVAEKIRKTVSEHRFETSQGVAHLTVSIGVATLSKTSRRLEHLLEDIDSALYKAKQKGRNQVVLFELNEETDHD